MSINEYFCNRIAINIATIAEITIVAKAFTFFNAKTKTKIIGTKLIRA